MGRVMILIAALAVAGGGLAAQDTVQADQSANPALYVIFGLSGSYERPSADPFVQYDSLALKAALDVGLDSKYFDIIARMSANGDGRYSSESSNVELPPFYVLMEEGGLRSKLGPVTIEAGRLRQYDVIDSPYSLFLNSGGHAPMMASLAYEDDRFFYSSRWLQLNDNSHEATAAWSQSGYSGFPDRGANLKVFGIKLGNMRFGFQDAAVYTGRSFDLEYLINPLLQYVIQYSKTTSGRPWYTGGNENNLIGLFWDWREPGRFSANAQFLMDDFNIHFLGIGPDNPWKAAMTAGGRLETQAGSFGLYAAGALQFTFNPIGMSLNSEADSAYGYTYYPDTRFNLAPAAISDAAIGIEDNSIGYKYGENNLAVQADWLGKAGGFDLGAAAEFRLAGANSPANPWGDWHSYPDGGTRWLQDPVLEKRILVGMTASRRFGSWKAYGNLTGGVAIDALRLRYSLELNDAGVPTPSNETPLEYQIMIFAPEAGLIQYILNATLGLSYEWRTR